MHHIILIDDDQHKGWFDVFHYMFQDIYKDLITFTALTSFDDNSIRKCYEDHPKALFIQDNNLGIGVKKGMEWIEEFAATRAIVLHTGDKITMPAKLAGQLAFFMQKDDPRNPMTSDEMKAMIVNFHKAIIKHFGLIPELMWIVYAKMGI